MANGLPATVAPGTSSATAAPATLDFHISDAFSVPTALDADSYVHDSGLLASPHHSDVDYDYNSGDDASFPFQATDLFDINEFLNDDINVFSNTINEHQQQQQHSDDCAAVGSSLLIPETLNSPEDPILQPHSGASSYGCDDGGIAVGVN